jgi:chemotaxis protein histidine kinase CheA
MAPMRARNRSNPASKFESVGNQDQSSSLIKVLVQSKPVSKAHDTFQKLVAKIGVKRDQLKEWQDYQPRFNQRLAGELVPLQTELRRGQRQMVELIDRLLSDPAPARRLKRAQREKLVQMLRHLLDELMQGDEDDKALVDLYDKYNDISHAENRQLDIEMAEAMLSDVFGVDLGPDHGASSAEELFENAQDKIRERAAQQRAQDQQKEQAWPSARASNRSKASAAKIEAARIRREQASQEIGQSLRDVYRKLVSALHPDREPDAQERARKTTLMQRVNQAYANKELLTLLGLQIEIEQIDANHLSTVPPERLTHYIEILREQLAGLERELAQYADTFGYLSPRGSALTPTKVDRELSVDLANLKVRIRILQGDLLAFRDPATLSAILKEYRLEDPDEDMDDMFEMMNTFVEPVGRRRGGRRR